jgi:hypothetical protein
VLDREGGVYSHPRVGVLDGKALRTSQKAGVYDRASAYTTLGAGVQWASRRGKAVWLREAVRAHRSPCVVRVDATVDRQSSSREALEVTEELTRPLLAARHPFVAVHPDGCVYANLSAEQFEETSLRLVELVVGRPTISSETARGRINPKEKSNARDALPHGDGPIQPPRIQC